MVHSGLKASIPTEQAEKPAGHTQGPWIFYADLPSVEPNWHIVTTANKLRVLANVHIEPGNQMDEANARLIAAAPELLAFAKAHEAWEAKVILEGDWSGEGVGLNAELHEGMFQLSILRNAAISKATGAA